jgi:sulfur relay (sulfurtransferase) DsrF/TusC family protein
MATGILSVGDVEICKVILMKDAVYFMDKHINPKILKMDDYTNILRLIDLSGIEIYIHDEALKLTGIDLSDLVLKDNVKIVDISEISELIIEADMSFKY